MLKKLNKSGEWKNIVLVMLICITFLIISTTGFSSEQSTPVELDFPLKAIQIVIPQSFGGSFDIIARIFASIAPEYLGTMVVIAKPGGSTVVGTAYVANATPDGYTLLQASIHAIVLRHFENIPVNVLEDLVPIISVAEQAWIMGVPGDNSPKPSPFYTLEDLVKFAKENPREIDMSNSGPMTMAQLPQLLLESYAGIEFTHIPYEGGGPNRLAWKQAEIDASVGPQTWVVPEAADGFIRPLAVAAEERIPDLPDVPTFKELGYDIVVNSINTFFAPKGVPEEILDYLESAFLKIAENQSFLSLMKKMNTKVIVRNSEETYEELKKLDDSSAKAAAIYKK